MVGEAVSDDGISSNKVYGLDTADNGRMTFEIDDEATKGVVLERIGLDLDELNQEITGYKVVNTIYPQMDTRNSTLTEVTFEFGASDIPSNTPTYSQTSTFDISTDYKIDSRVSGDTCELQDDLLR